MTDTQRRARAEAALLGSAVGDALGWPMEDRSGRVGGRRGVQPSFEFGGWQRREGGRYQPHEEEISAGSYSDDTQLTLAVARSILFGDDWWTWLTRVELPFWLLYERGGGGATKRAATAWSRSTPPWHAKTRSRYFEAGGNGVAMRIVPHCLSPEASNFEDVARSVIADGITTHGHPRALLGAVLQAYSFWICLRQNDVLGYGQLIETARASEEWLRFFSPDDVDGWAEAAMSHFARPYQDVWGEVADEIHRLLDVCRDGIGRGSLAVDRPVLEAIGCFGPASGAGTVSAAGALFLASRYAAQPQGGVVAAAFAKGADTDTLAAMTGALLGAIHGDEWLSLVSKRVQDAEYVRGIAARAVSNDRHKPDPQLLEARPTTSRAFWKQFGEKQMGESVVLPDGRHGVVRAVLEHRTKRDGLRPRTWVVDTSDGQTLHLKRVAKVPVGELASRRPTRAAQAKEDDRRVRIGVVLHVADLEQSRTFYRDLVGLAVSRSSPARTVFAGLLALEPLPSSLREEGVSEQLPLLTDDPPGDDISFDARSAITIYLSADDFTMTRRRLEDTGRQISPIATAEGREVFRCLDPDGNVVEFRSARG
jgi:ADP-ribosylglycohydrolase/catechol 2,3-dioxygenase-like lactoylglutathione lyase family enzyme